MPKRIALYGGAFDPPHYGHLLAALGTLCFTDAEELWVAPSYIHPYGKKMESFKDRMEMCYRAFAPLDSDLVLVSGIERMFSYIPGKGLTADVLEYLFETHTYVEHVTLVLGSDIEVEKWEGYDRIEGMVLAGKVSIHHVRRADGFSSTEVKREMLAGKTPQGLLPSVLEYITNHGLYSKEPS